MGAIACSTYNESRPDQRWPPLGIIPERRIARVYFLASEDEKAANFHRTMKRQYRDKCVENTNGTEAKQ